MSTDRMEWLIRVAVKRGVGVWLASEVRPNRRTWSNGRDRHQRNGSAFMVQCRQCWRSHANNNAVWIVTMEPRVNRITTLSCCNSKHGPNLVPVYDLTWNYETGAPTVMWYRWKSVNLLCHCAFKIIVILKIFIILLPNCWALLRLLHHITITNGNANVRKDWRYLQLREWMDFGTKCEGIRNQKMPRSSCNCFYTRQRVGGHARGLEQGLSQLHHWRDTTLRHEHIHNER